MRRTPWLALLLVSLLFAPAFAAPEEPAPADPTAAKLERAKEGFHQKVERFKADLAKDLEAKENQARAKGDKKLVDQVKAERTAFAERGVLPRSVPTTTFDTRVKQARGEVEAAYAAAIKDLVKNRKDDQAGAIEKKLAAFVRDADAASGAVDLLAMIDVAVDGTKGRWAREGRGVSNQLDKRVASYIQIPYTPPDEYELELVVERTAGANDLMIAPVLSGRRFFLVLDGWNSTSSGISFLDGKGASDNETTIHTKLFTNGKPSMVVARITKAEVTVTVDGKPALKYVGVPERLGGADPGVVRAGVPFLAVTGGTSYRIDVLRLKPISGTGRPLR